MYASSSDEAEASQLFTLPTPALSSSSSFSRPPSRRESVVSFQYSSDSSDERIQRRKAWRSPRRSRAPSLTTSPALLKVSLPPLPPPASPTFQDDEQLFPDISIQPISEEPVEEDYLTFHHHSTSSRKKRRSSSNQVVEIVGSTKPFTNPRISFYPNNPQRRRGLLKPLRSTTSSSTTSSYQSLVMSYLPGKLEFVLKGFVLMGVSMVVVGLLVGSYFVSVWDDLMKWVESMNGNSSKREAKVAKEGGVEERVERPRLMVLVPTLLFVMLYSTFRMMAAFWPGANGGGGGGRKRRSV